MIARGADWVLETAPGRLAVWLAQRPVVRPMAQGMRAGVVRLYWTLARLQPAHRRHDALQRQTLAAFEAGTATSAPARAAHTPGSMPAR